eukprot:2610362-Rhodomonas_salina.1
MTSDLVPQVGSSPPKFLPLVLGHRRHEVSIPTSHGTQKFLHRHGLVLEPRVPEISRKQVGSRIAVQNRYPDTFGNVVVSPLLTRRSTAVKESAPLDSFLNPDLLHCKLIVLPRTLRHA